VRPAVENDVRLTGRGYADLPFAIRKFPEYISCTFAPTKGGMQTPVLQRTDPARIMVIITIQTTSAAIIRTAACCAAARDPSHPRHPASATPRRKRGAPARRKGNLPR